jgi:uncharacterized protein involved in exopolysaccharide biosynthesis
MSDKEPSISDVLLAVDRLRRDVMTLRGDMMELRVDLVARLDRQHDALAALRDDIVAVSFGRADRAAESAKSLRTEVDHIGTELAAMGRQIQRLQTDVRALKGEP